jgi:hypothetical protein
MCLFDGGYMTNEKYALALVAVGNMAREMQIASSSGWKDDKVYELATKIMLECQVIRNELNAAVHL